MPGCIVRTAALAILVVSTFFQDAISTCLKNRVDGIENITLSGITIPVGFTPGDWHSSILLAQIAKIISQEILGFNIKISGKFPTSKVAFTFVAGCVVNDETCWKESDAIFHSVSPHHVIFEVWMLPNGRIGYDAMKEAHPDRAGDLLGDIGYKGSEGFYVPIEPINEALNQEGLFLSYYQSYNNSWFDPSKYFTRIWDGDFSKLLSCAERPALSVLMDSALIQGYSTYFGKVDPNGVNVAVDATNETLYMVKCHDGNNTWWLSPACRAAPETCVPALTYLGWYGAQLMQQATFYNMPFAMAEAGWEDFLSLSLRKTVMHYWWTPDVTFLAKGSKFLVFPNHDKDQYNRKHFITATADTDLVTGVHKDLQWVAPLLYKTLSAIKISFGTVDSLLLGVMANMSHHDIACNFLRQTTAWRSWITNPLLCDTGSGLHDVDAAPVFAMARATGCERCPVGRFSEALNGTRVCQLCQKGKAVNYMGAMECEKCTAGTYASTEGNVKCSDCMAGKFTSSLGSTTCAQHSVAIGILAPNIEAHSCGPSRALGALLAAKDVQDRNGRWVPELATLENFDLIVCFGDTRLSPAGSVSAAMECTGIGGGAAHAIFLVGPLSSSASRATAFVMNFFDIGLVSYASSDPGLSNKQLYPLFFRTDTSKSVKPLAILSRSLSIEKVNILASSRYSDDDVHHFQEQFNETQIETTAMKFPESPDGMNKALVRSLLETLRIRIWRTVLVLCFYADCLTVFTTAADLGMMSPTWVWFGTDNMAQINGPYQLGLSQGRTVQEMERSFKGTLAIVGDDQGAMFNNFDNYWRCSRMNGYEDCGLERDLRSLQQNGAEWFNRTQSAANFKWGSDTFEKACSKRTYAYDATVAVALAINALLHRGVEVNKSSLVGALRNVSFDGLSGKVAFTETQDRATPYNIINIVGGNDQFLRKVGSFVEGDAQISWILGTSEADAGIVWPGNVYAVPSGRAPICSEGLFYNQSYGLCMLCPAGSFNSAAGQACTKCPAGTYGIHEGSKSLTDCTRCPAGHYGSASGSINISDCVPCPAGKSTDYKDGQSECSNCTAGNFADRRGQQRCSSCNLGKYSDKLESTACSTCPPTTTTQLKGATTKGHCVCPINSYYFNRFRKCIECTDTELIGLNCPGFFAPWLLNRSGVDGDVTVRVKESYMIADVRGKLAVFQCAADSVCVGERQFFVGSEVNAKGMCTGQSKGISCAECNADTYRAQSGACEVCTGSILLTFCQLFAGAVLVGFVTIHQTMFPFSAIGGILLTLLSFAQAIAICLVFDISYPDLFSSSSKGSNALLRMNFYAWAAPTDCITGAAFLPNFAWKLCNPITLVGGQITIFLVSRLVRHTLPSLSCCAEPQLRCIRIMNTVAENVQGYTLSTQLGWFWPLAWQDLVNALIALAFRFFISITNVALSLFKFTTHLSTGDDGNGIRTLTSFMRVEEGSSEWWSALPVAVIATFVYVIGPFAFIVYIVLVAPRQASDPATGKNFRRSYRVIWREFRPGVWWFGLVHLLYDLGLNMATVLITNARNQLFFSTFLITVVCLLTIFTRPHKFAVNLECAVVAKLGILGLLFVLTNAKSVDEFDDNELGVAALSLLALTFLVILLQTAYYVITHHIRSRQFGMSSAKIGQRLHDVSLIVGAQTIPELRAYARGLVDLDRKKLMDAMDTILFTMIGLQNRKFWKQRVGSKPFEIDVNGRLEGELCARDLRSPEDPREQIRRLIRFMEAQYSGTASSNWSIQSSISKITGEKKIEEFVTDAVDRLFAIPGSDSFTEATFVKAVRTYMTELHQDMFSDQQLINIFRYCNYDGNDSIDKAVLALNLSHVPAPVYPRSELKVASQRVDESGVENGVPFEDAEDGGGQFAHNGNHGATQDLSPISARKDVDHHILQEFSL